MTPRLLALLAPLLLLSPVESPTTIKGIRIAPDSVELSAGDSVQFCAFVRFPKNIYAMRSPDRADCDSLYQQFPAKQRVVSVRQQAKADSVCIQWSATAGTIGSEVCP